MIGINSIGVYKPELRIDNKKRSMVYNLDEEFLEQKIGFSQLSKKHEQEKSSDLCVKSFEKLLQSSDVDLEKIDFVCVCTQNGDYQLPHTSAVVHDKLSLRDNCAVFDVSLGCSGYVYGLHVAKSFMEQNGFENGLFFTSDPYSEIVDESDKSTSLLFGDAATVTYLSSTPVLTIQKGEFFSAGKKHRTLIKRDGESLYMNGREIFNYVLANAPNVINRCLENNNVSKDDIDAFLLHQASKYVFSKLVERMGLNFDKAPFSAGRYGNTVSSSIPILLEEHMSKNKSGRVLISGFGVGLSLAATILEFAY